MNHSASFAEKILAGRLREFGPVAFDRNIKPSDEGGCGVTGFASNVPLAGRHIFEPSVRMHNRGNGKGGGIAAVGMNPDMLGVTREVLDSHYMLNVALLDPACLDSLKESSITPFFQVAKEEIISHVPDYRSIEGLEVKPPDIWRAFVRVKLGALKQFIEENGLQGMPERYAEDEFVSRNSARLNKKFYSFSWREGSLCPFPRPKRHDPEDRGLCRKCGQILQARRLPSSCLDRPPAISYPRTSVASGRSSSFHRSQRSSGPQRGLCQLPRDHRVPEAEGARTSVHDGY